MSSLAMRDNPIKRSMVSVVLALALAASLQSGQMFSSASASQGSKLAVYVESSISRIHDGFVSIIVQKTQGSSDVSEKAVRKLGGKITRELPIINGYSATLPATAVPSLTQLPGTRAITQNRTIRLQGGGSSNNPKSVFANETRADLMWLSGATGQGVTVALIDTGIANVADLAGRVLPVYDDVSATYSPCENLSGEPDCTDSYGHGTFIAGLIAGDGSSSAGAFKGMAPGASLVSVKIAGRDGSSDVSNLLAAIQWVVSFKDRYGIKVLNLSLGTDGTQSYQTDPLNYAVEKAWDAGIAVVVSASNRGPNSATISKPGDDPWVITVGAIDDMGTKPISDDEIPDFSARGPTAADGLAKPDVVAPGGHLISLRAPGSAIDTQFPTYIDNYYRRGSGTSMSAGLVSGAAALILQANPLMTPDRLKFALTSTARNVASHDSMAVGHGLIDTYSATYSAPPGLANLGNGRSTGLGTLDASRGTVRVQTTDPNSTLLSGLLTTQLLLWDSITYTGTSWYGTSWYGTSWYGTSWYGTSWYGTSWYGTSWYGTSWYGQPNGTSWYGTSWYGGSWYGAWE